MKIRHITAQLAMLLCVLTVSSAKAQDPLQINPASPWYAWQAKSGWHFDVGLGVEYEPAYPGSDEYSAEPDVFARALYRTNSGNRYFISLGEVGAMFSLSDRTQLQVFLEYEEAREADDDEALRGLDEVDATIEGQFMLARRYGNISTYAVLQPDLTGDANKGLVWFVGAGYDRMLANGVWRISTTFDISGADQEYMNTEFGISSIEARRTGYREYEASAGLKSASWAINAEHWFRPDLSVLFNVEAEYYCATRLTAP